MDNNEETFDCLILGILKEYPFISLSGISKQLRLPKSLIIRRLEYLCNNDYVKEDSNSFRITMKGNHIAVSPEALSDKQAEYFKDNDCDEFDWENSGYTPKPESFDNLI